MLQTNVSSPSFLRRVVASAETRVVFPAPWTPFRPMKNGLEALVGRERWRESWRRMKGMQWGDLSSIIGGLGAVRGEGAADIARVLTGH